MNKKIFLWLHMHQPDYLESTTGNIILPWVRRHSLNGYYTVAKLLEQSNFKANINFSGILLEQIQRYQKAQKDVYQIYEEKEPSDFTESEIDFIIKRFNTPPSFRSERFESIKENYKATRKISEQDLLDLQTIFKLSAFAPIDKEIIELRKKEKFYSKNDKKVVIELESKIINELFDLYSLLQKRNQIEITFTPYHHPILPLLLDIKVAKESKHDAIIPNMETHFYEDAKLHTEESIKKIEEIFDITPTGCWPAEGSISDETIQFLKSSGTSWLGSDEALVKPLGLGQGVYELNGVKLFLRNHEVSDKIGFVYNKMKPKDAMTDLKNEVDKNGTLILILDGENPWEYFDNYGVDFLKNLFNTFSEKDSLLGSEVDTATSINKILPGSWIDGYFDTWIGDEETNTAWIELIDAKSKINTKESFNEICKSEASDYFWWYSDFHKQSINFDFDTLFRGRLIEAYKKSNLEVPHYLYYPIKKFPLGG